MHNSIDRLIAIKKEIHKKKTNLNIVAVSKTFQMTEILPLINYGHDHYGENKVQEAVEKWSEIKSDFKSIKLHMIGKLQTNKVKYVVPLFDYIHSLDNLKLAEKLSNEQLKINKKLKIFIQVNIGNENQKNGISTERVEDFYNICNKDLGLNIVGLMCLPPIDSNTKVYFAKMQKLKKQINLSELSMGMSDDYLKAIKYDATYLRIGSKIFGSRS